MEKYYYPIKKVLDKSSVIAQNENSVFENACHLAGNVWLFRKKIRKISSQMMGNFKNRFSFLKKFLDKEIADRE